MLLILRMYKISIDKNLFEDILLKKIHLITKATTRYWKKELLEPTIINDKISYQIKQIEQVKLTNGLGEEKPSIVVECKKVDYNGKKDIFEFTLGRIIEQKNTDIQDDYKDTLIEQLLKEKAELQDSINKDHLTKIYNRRKMEDDLGMFVNQNNANSLNAVFIDADRFKGINDTFGHDYGDKVLIYLGEKLKEYAERLNGEVYRYGGEEFLILCFCDEEFLLKSITQLRVDISSQRVYHPTRAISLTVSMGVSFYKLCNNKNDLVKKADEALFRAKSGGRNRVELMK